MFNTVFGHDLIKKYVILFGTLFNNLHVQRFDNDGVLTQTSKVPLNYGPREKFLARVDGNRDGNRQIAIQLPRISFEITNIYYDPMRARQRTQKVSIPHPTNPDIKTYQYSPTPYNFDFQLSIMVKNAQDGAFIVEQILPYFTPDFTATLLINPDLGLKYDVPININSITTQDTYEGDFVNRRAIIWELNFTLKGWIFGPTNATDGKIIKEIDLSFRMPSAGHTIDSANSVNTLAPVSIQMTPGQYANGDAAAWYGDATANTRPTVVAANTVTSSEEWGFMTDFTENI